VPFFRLGKMSIADGGLGNSIRVAVRLSVLVVAVRGIDSVDGLRIQRWRTRRGTYLALHHACWPVVSL
jgi:hypothetical protein